MGKRKSVIIMKLTSEGHTAVEVNPAEAYTILGQCLDQGQYVFCEPEKVVISKRSDLRGHDIEKAIIFAAVAGG